jgi:hypothetical protein
MEAQGLWQQQGKRAEAYDLLAPIYGWFTEANRVRSIARGL